MRPVVLLAALLAGSAVIAGCGVNDPYQPSSPPAPTANATTNATTTATPPPAASTSATSRSNDANEAEPALSPVQHDAQRRGERAARAFLAAYLPYSYSQRPAAAIRAATPALKRELARQPPRVSAQLAKSAHPRVRSLRASGLTRTRVYVLAQVDDGQTVYGTTLTVERRGARWLVSEVE